MPGATRTAIGITGNRGELEPGTFEELVGVQEVIRVSKPYKLVSRELKEDDTIIRFPDSDATIGGMRLRLSPGRAALSRVSKPLPPANASPRLARVFSVGARTNRGRRRMRFKVWANWDYRFWPRCASVSAC